ncbi:MAG: DUF1636 domain-containing protein [Thermostichales cyanobacterium BF4_bins_65]
MARAVVFVCRYCLFAPQQPTQDGKSGGQHLWEALQEQLPTWPYREQVEWRQVDCLSGCSHPCTVAVAAPGKLSCLFGELPPLLAAPQVLAFLEKYLQSEDGAIPRPQRPPLLQPGLLAKIPPP